MPTLTVASAVSDRSLVALSALKADLGITGTDQDARLTQWIKDDSDAVCEACGVAPDQLGRRTFLAEAVSITYRAAEIPQACGQAEPLILPWRIPLALSSVTVDGTALTVPDDVEIEPMAGLLWRVGADGCRRSWERGRVVITGTAGWDQDGVPAALRRAVIDCVKLRWDAKDQNSYVTRERVDGVGEQQFWVGDVPNSVGGLQASTMDALRAAGLVNAVVG